MTTQPTTSIETPAIILTTPLDYGRQKAKECGRKRVSDEMAMKYAEPGYYWEVRDLLETKSFNSMKSLFSFFYSLYLLADNKTAKSALCCGFVNSARKREHSISPFLFESDTDFQNLYKIDAINVNRMEIVIEYFTSRPVEPTLDELKAQYSEMTLDEVRTIKNNKYPNMDITTAMSNDEKAITAVVAQKFSELNQKIKEKRQAEKDAANQAELTDLAKVSNTELNYMLKFFPEQKAVGNYDERTEKMHISALSEKNRRQGEELKEILSNQVEPSNQTETMQPQPTTETNNFENLSSFEKSFAKNYINAELKTRNIESLVSEFETALLDCKESAKISYYYVLNELQNLTEPSNQTETMQTLPQQPQTLSVGQTIYGENCYLVVTAIKEPKQASNEPKESELQTELKNKSKITMSTLKSFIKKADSLFVLGLSSFDGMEDGVRYNKNPKLIPVTKDDAIGQKGVWCVGSSRDMLKYYETETHFGIEVYNCCGCEILLTKK